jgi:hypothetical protein
VKRATAKLLFFVAALPAIVRAAGRATWHERRLPLDELVARLRAVTPWKAGRRLADPHWLLASLDRLLPLLPPWRYGRCLRRSLLLLDLWSRCGLSTSLHLGVRGADEGRYEGHAWVTATWPGGEVGPATSAQGYPEAFEL